MAKFRNHFLLFTSSLFLIILPSSSKEGFPPPTDAFVAPINKDAATSLYTIPISADNGSYVVDITNPLPWLVCPRSHPTVPCNSTTCVAARSFPPLHCRASAFRRHPCICTAYSVNPVNGNCASGDVTLTNVIISSTDGRNPVAVFDLDRVASACAPTWLLERLPKDAVGIAGLARAGRALQTQLAARFRFKRRQFALCLPGSGNNPGVAFFGDGPFFLLPPPGIDVTAMLKYTPLLKNPTNPAYYIDVRGLAVNQHAVRLPAGVLALDAAGRGGVRFSTTVPYTTMRSDVYKPLLAAFSSATSGISRMPAVKPFELCYNSSALGSTRVGYGVPQIDVMLVEGKNWTIFGANSVVDVGPKTACFAFVNGGRKAEQAVMVGGFQMENSLFMFDEGKSRLGYTSTLSGIRTGCANFNFTMNGQYGP